MSLVSVVASCLVGFALGGGLRLVLYGMKLVRPSHRWLLVVAGLAFLAPPVIALVVVAGEELVDHPLVLPALTGAGVGLGWLLGTALRVLPRQRPHYFARHRGRRQYRHLRNPETDPKPPGPNPFISGPLQPPPPEDAGNPFKDLNLTDERPAE